MYPSTKQLTMYGNNPINIGNGITSITLKINNVKEEVDLWVVEDWAQSHNLLIGRTFAVYDNVTFIKIKNKVIFGYDYIVKFDDIIFSTAKSTRIEFKEDQVLKANEVTVVATSINKEVVEILRVNYSSNDTVLSKG